DTPTREPGTSRRARSSGTSATAGTRAARRTCTSRSTRTAAARSTRTPPSASTASREPAGVRDEALAAGLEAVLAERGRVGRVDGLARLSGGASRETFAFDLVADDGSRSPLILQRTR